MAMTNVRWGKGTRLGTRMRSALRRAGVVVVALTPFMSGCGGGVWVPPPITKIPVAPPGMPDRADDGTAVDPLGKPAHPKGAASAKKPGDPQPSVEGFD